MTSLITSVSDSLQICLLLFTCCHSASQPANQSVRTFSAGVRQPAGLLLTTLAGGDCGEREEGNAKDEGGADQSGQNRWTRLCTLASLFDTQHTRIEADTSSPCAAGRIWSLFKSLNYSWLKIHGEPFIWKLGAAQAALWCLIGLKVASSLNKSGRRAVAARVLRMRIWEFTTHLPLISCFFYHSNVVQWL